MRNPILSLLLLISLNLSGANPAAVSWGNEEADTLRITTMLKNAGATVASDNPQDFVLHFAEQFIDTPYAGGTLESTRGEERLTIRLDSLDCTTLVETVMALSRTASLRRTSWRDFIDNLQELRYRRGIIDGYPSRLHYISDWIVDNSSRGNLEEVTSRIPSATYDVKTIDFMSTHRDAYPALASDDNLRAIKNVENGYRSHRYPIVKKGSLVTDKSANAALRDGDIVALTTDIRGLDVSHLGIIKIVDGTPHLLHASSKAGKVTVSTEPIGDYLRRNRRLTGLRVIRLTR